MDASFMAGQPNLPYPSEIEMRLINHGFPLPSLKLTANAPENRPSQKETSLPIIPFQVRAVSFGEGNKAEN